MIGARVVAEDMMIGVVAAAMAVVVMAVAEVGDINGVLVDNQKCFYRAKQFMMAIHRMHTNILVLRGCFMLILHRIFLHYIL